MTFLFFSAIFKNFVGVKYRRTGILDYTHIITHAVLAWLGMQISTATCRMCAELGWFDG